MTTEQQSHRLEGIEQITVNDEDVIAAMRRNRRDEREQRSHCLRVMPPFEGERKAKPHVTEPHTRYPHDVTKPYHFAPEAFIIGHVGGSTHPDFQRNFHAPDLGTAKAEYRDQVPDEEQDEATWDEWWSEVNGVWESTVRHHLDKTDTLVIDGGPPSYDELVVPVNVE